jgi:hypothetical protein
MTRLVNLPPALAHLRSGADQGQWGTIRGHRERTNNPGQLDVRANLNADGNPTYKCARCATEMGSGTANSALVFYAYWGARALKIPEFSQEIPY